MMLFFMKLFSVKSSRFSIQRLMLLLLLVSTLHACGFQLRGAVDISQDVAPIYIQQNSAFDLFREIKTLLAANKITVTENPGKANSQLTLLNEAQTRRVLSVDADGRAREYLLTYTVNFSVKIKKMNEKAESISITRSLLFDPNAVNAVVNQSEVLYKDMRRDASRLILLKLQAHSLNAEKQQAVIVVKPSVVKF